VGDVSVEAEVVSTVVGKLGELDVVHQFLSCGVFLCYKYASIQMIKHGQGGCIVGVDGLLGRCPPPHINIGEIPEAFQRVLRSDQT